MTRSRTSDDLSENAHPTVRRVEALLQTAVVRFLGLDGARELDRLGFSRAAEARLRDALALQDGAIVVIGPCSSGKSTTLRAMAREIVAARGEFTHVASAEDPVEQRLPGV